MLQPQQTLFLLPKAQIRVGWKGVDANGRPFEAPLDVEEATQEGLWVNASMVPMMTRREDSTHVAGVIRDMHNRQAPRKTNFWNVPSRIGDRVTQTFTLDLKGFEEAESIVLAISLVTPDADLTGLELELQIAKGDTGSNLVSYRLEGDLTSAKTVILGTFQRHSDDPDLWQFVPYGMPSDKPLQLALADLR